MAHAYTPGLKVLQETLIRKTRILPLKGEVHVGEGEACEPQTVVAATSLPGNVQMVNVAGQLNIEPADVTEAMLVKEGSAIARGDALARSKGIFGLFKSTLASPIDGTMESVSSVTGQVVLREAPIPVEVNAYVRGKVVEVIAEEGVVVETHGAFIQGIFGIGGERQGEIKVVVDNPSEELTADHIDESCRGKIIIGGSWLRLATMRKAMSLEVAGIIVGGFDYENLKPMLGYDLGVAITGQEDTPTTLVVTEGYGSIDMAERSFQLLKRYEGRIASINGATQIRAGVIRPEIIVPLADSELSGDGQQSAEITGIEPGSLVRIIRAPWFGVIGKVVSLPHELREMESGTLVRVAEVELPDGSARLLPRANLEMVETD